MGPEKDKTVEDHGRILQLLLDVLDSLVELKLFVGGAFNVFPSGLLIGVPERFERPQRPADGVVRHDSGGALLG